jgi:hypothetical protein
MLLIISLRLGYKQSISSSILIQHDLHSDLYLVLWSCLSFQLNCASPQNSMQ